MVLNINGGLFKDNGLFKASPEDGQVDSAAGLRKVPITPTDTILTSPLDNELNILDLQQATAITPVTYSGSRTDVFSDADGFVDSVDTGNTTAKFDTDKYLNDPSFSDATLYQSSGISHDDFSLVKTWTLPDVLIEQVRNYLDGDDPGETYYCKIIFKYTDTTTASVTKSQFLGSGDYKIYTNPNPTKTIATIEAWLSADDSNDETYINESSFTGIPSDFIIQSNVLTIGTGAQNFQVIAYRNATTGTGTITADISFDNGAHYITVELETNTEIINRGTQLIIKIKLNAGASEGEASCKGYGVSFWGAG